MLHKTKGIVLRTTKYRETSLIASVYTEMFGLQSYLVSGVRASSRRGAGRANIIQPASILEMVVYQNELKNLQRIKEFGYASVYQDLFFNVTKHAVALFMVEMILKCVKQPEPNEDLFHFAEEAFLRLDNSPEPVVANYALFFSLHLAGFFGFRIKDDYSSAKSILDLQEGVFVAERPLHGYYLADTLSYATSQLLKVMQPEELAQIGLNRQMRKELLKAFQNFYALHIADFGVLRTIPVLQIVFGE